MLVTAQQQLSVSQDSPILGVALLAAAIWVCKLWWQDYHTQCKGEALPGAIPGATACHPGILWMAAFGGCVLVLLETAAEYLTGFHSSQTIIPAWYLAPMIAAAVLEEVIFRGYLPIVKKGRTVLVICCLLLSVVFALAHPHLWSWRDQQLNLHIDSGKAWLTTTALFANSLCLYTLRFGAFNPRHSLLPCVVAHTVINLLTFGIKAQQGFVH
jgi:membrane protease YdiL (CAAX protease family)